jgi:serine O-acetyltransferase
LKAVLLADVERQWRASGREGRPSALSDIVKAMAGHRFHPVLLLRLTLWAEAHGHAAAARVLSYVNITMFGVEVALQSRIGPGLYLPHPGGIVLGAASIGSGVTIYQGVTLGAQVLDHDFTDGLRPTVGDSATIASGAKVLGGVHVGAAALVGANAVVVRDVADGDVVGGVPARSLRGRETAIDGSARADEDQG